MSAIVFREARPSDMPFVVASMLSSLRTAYANSPIRMSNWFELMRPEIEALLARPGCEVWVAAHPSESPESRADLYGWCAFERVVHVPDRQGVKHEAEGPLIHYVYVKADYRRRGIARGLLTAAGIRLDLPFLYTCRTGVCKEILPPHARWAPLVARYPKDET